MRPSRRLVALAAPGVVAVAASALLSAGDWPAARAPFWVSRPLTAPGRFTNNAEGPEFTRDGRLFAVNCERDGTICEVHPDGRAEVVVTLPEGSTANAIRETSSGALMLADYKGHNVLRLDVGTRRVTTFVHDDRFNQPNDLAISRRDVLYASDPNWARETGQLWRIDPDGRVTLLASDLGTTNGVTLSPDERVLYVGESVQRRVLAFDLDEAGQPAGRRVFATFPDFGLDGMKCDSAGRLYVTRHGKGTVAVLDPSGALVREVPIAEGRNVSNLVFGGPDRRTAFLTLQDTGRMATVTVE
jgi:sugar lactone lactonase YvrE